MIISARKPEFFQMSHPLYEVVTGEGLMRPCFKACKGGLCFVHVLVLSLSQCILYGRFLLDEQIFHNCVWILWCAQTHMLVILLQIRPNFDYKQDLVPMDFDSYH